MYGVMNEKEKNSSFRGTEFLIVGQGLAGTMLAFELHWRGKDFVVVDSPSSEQASRVAAGIINPVVFRRLTKSWLVDDLFPVLKNTYHELEKLLSCQLLHPLKIKTNWNPTSPLSQIPVFREMASLLPMEWARY
jgi:hypothetical protein